MNYDNPARAASLLGKRKVSEVQRHQSVQRANGVNSKEALKQSLSNVDGMSVADKYHASKGKEGSIINKVLGGRFG